MKRMTRRLAARSLTVALLSLLISLLAGAQAPGLTVEGYDVLSSSPTASFTTAEEIQAPYLAVAVGPFLRILDQSDPSSPVEVSEMALPSAIRDMAYAGGTLAIADGVAGLILVDVSNPLTPRLEGSSSDYFGLSVAVDPAAKYAYLAGGEGTFPVYNIKNPARPRVIRLKSYNKATFSHLVRQNEALVAAAGGKGILVYSLQQPKNPVLMSRVEDLTAVSRVAVNDRLVAASDSEAGLVFIEYAKWSEPEVQGSLFLDPVPADFHFFNDGLLLVAQASGGYSIVDATAPAQPTVTAQGDQPAPAKGAYSAPGAWGGYLFCGDQGMWGVNLAGGPAHPATVLLASGGASAGILAVSGDLAFVAVDSSIRILDLQNPSQPATLGILPTDLPAVDMVVEGDLLFASCQTAGLMVVDVSNPAVPSVLSQIQFEESAGQMDLSGSLLVVADGASSVAMVDVSDPLHPTLLGTYEVDHGYVRGVVFSEPTVVWVGGSREGVFSLDLSDPTAPQKLGEVRSNQSGGDIAVKGETLYLAESTSGLTIIDITDPASPQRQISIETSMASRLFLRGEDLLLCDGENGLREFDVSTPYKPVVKAFFQTPSYCIDAGILADGTRIVTARDSGMWTLAPADCDGPTLKLPCDDDVLSSLAPMIFTWEAVEGAKYKVKISHDPGFPKGKTFTGLDGQKALKSNGWIPGTLGWRKIKKKGREGVPVYWRVVTVEGNSKTVSETRSFTLD